MAEDWRNAPIYDPTKAPPPEPEAEGDWQSAPIYRPPQAENDSPLVLASGAAPSPGQTETYRLLKESGLYDPQAPGGSAANPFYAPEGATVPPGTFAVGPDGRFFQEGDDFGVYRELNRRGMLTEQEQGEYFNAIKSGQATEDNYASGQMASRGASGELAAGIGAFNDGTGFLDEASAGMAATIGTGEQILKGERPDFGQNWTDARDFQRGQQSDFSSRRPVASNLLKGTGLAAQAATAMTPIGGPAAAANAVRTEQGLAGAASAVGRNAVVGGGMAALSAAGGEGTLSERLQNASKAVPAGAAIGGGVPIAGTVASAGVRKAGQVIADTGRSVAGAANRATMSIQELAGQPASGFMSSTEAAAQRVRQTLERRGITREQVDATAAQLRDLTGREPSMIDVLTRLNVTDFRSLARGSASQGEGAAIAGNYAKQTASEAPDLAAGYTRALTPGNTKSAQQAVDDLTATRADLASKEYPGPYSEPVTLDAASLSALRGPDGQAAINSAMQTARARRDYDQMQELQDLLTADLDQPPTISAGTVDRVQQAFGETGRSLMKGDQRGMAGGMFGRQKDLNSTLDNTPGLAEARASYKDLSKQITGVETGEAAFAGRVDPRDFAQVTGDLTKVSDTGPQPPPRGLGGTKEAIQVGARAGLEGKIFNIADGQTGVLNNLSSNRMVGENLTTAFGDEVAGKYQSQLGQTVTSVQNARFLDPGTNSQTAGRALDQGLVSGTGNMPLSPLGALSNILAKLERGFALSDQERGLIVQFATKGQDDPLVAGVLKGLRQNQALPFDGRPVGALGAAAYGSALGN